jgi:TorA maturation chaperone TorD
MSANATDPTVLLARADLLLTLAVLFAPPTALTTTAVRAMEPADFEGLACAAGHAEGKLVGGLAELTALARERTDAWVEEHARLFEGAGAGRANETNYVRRDRGAILGDIAGFHTAFGVAAVGSTGERIDHMTAELEFLAFLLVMEANAHQRDPAQITISRDAIGRFLTDHLGLWVGALRAEIDGVLPGGFFARLAAITDGLCHEIAASYGVTLVVYGNPPRSDLGTPFECGAVEKTTAGSFGSEHVINPGVE